MFVITIDVRSEVVTSKTIEYTIPQYFGKTICVEIYPIIGTITGKSEGIYSVKTANGTVHTDQVFPVSRNTFDASKEYFEVIDRVEKIRYINRSVFSDIPEHLAFTCQVGEFWDTINESVDFIDNENLSFAKAILFKIKQYIN